MLELSVISKDKPSVVLLRETENPKKPPLEKRRHILIVDDAETIRFFLRTSLVSEGFVVYEEETGMKALKLVQEKPVDLVIIDLGLPDMDGIDLLSMLNQNMPELPVIILTVRDDSATKAQVFLNGAREFITKPFDVEEILNVIDGILDIDPNVKH